MQLKAPPSINDLTDVSVPAPVDQYFLYWDDAAALWKCRALVDVDIPASIARDAEVAAAVAAINLVDLADVQIPMPVNLDFIYWDAVAGKWVNISYANLLLSIQGDTNLDDLHDVGASSPDDGYFLAFDAATNLWKAVKGYAFGPNMPTWENESQFFHWTITLTGSGAIVSQGYGTLRLNTLGTAGSTARGRGYGFGWVDYSVSHIEWFMSIIHRNSTTNGRKWYKIDSDTAADPTGKAIGFRVDANALKGIVYSATGLHVIDLGVTLTVNVGYRLFLSFVPGDKIEWYVDGVKKGESTDIPVGLKASLTYCVIAVANNADAAGNQIELVQHSWIHVK